MSESILEKVEREAAEKETTRQAVVKRYEHFLRGSFIRELASPWQRGIYWSAGGLRRLADVRGFLRGLLAGVSEKGEKTAFGLFVDLNEKLDYLNGYGGDLEATFGSGRPIKNVPAWKVWLGDDGTHHGFSLTWARALQIEKHHELRDNDPEGTAHRVLTDETGRLVERLAFACQAGDQEAERRTYVYTHAFNGGLLYHGPGGDELFSVEIGSATGRPTLWAVHT